MHGAGGRGGASGGSGMPIEDAFARYTVPGAECGVVGKRKGSSTRVSNVKAICEHLGRSPQLLTRFMAAELGTRCVLERSGGDPTAVVKGAFSPEEIDACVDAFARMFVVCAADGNPETRLQLLETGADAASDGSDASTGDFGTFGDVPNDVADTTPVEEVEERKAAPRKGKAKRSQKKSKRADRDTRAVMVCTACNANSPLPAGHKVTAHIVRRLLELRDKGSDGDSDDGLHAGVALSSAVAGVGAPAAAGGAGEVTYSIGGFTLP